MKGEHRVVEGVDVIVGVRVWKVIGEETNRCKKINQTHNEPLSIRGRSIASSRNSEMPFCLSDSIANSDERATSIKPVICCYSAPLTCTQSNPPLSKIFEMRHNGQGSSREGGKIEKRGDRNPFEPQWFFFFFS